MDEIESVSVPKTEFKISPSNKPEAKSGDDQRESPAKDGPATTVVKAGKKFATKKFGGK